MEKRNFKEIAKTNKFIANAGGIREICITEGVDIGVGLDMYCDKNGMKKGGEDYQEFRELCKETPLDTIIGEL